LTALGLFIGAFLLTYITIPKIIGVVRYKKLLDEPNQRSSHIEVTPTLGGVAFYFSLMFSFFFLKDYDQTKIIYHLFPGLTILFIFGLKDDLVVLSPLSKLGAQFTAVYFILAHPELQINSLHGFLGYQEIPTYIAILLSAFLMIVVINAYNLIDGIDGLAAGIGIAISTIYASLFYFLDIDLFFYLALILIATLTAFLRYNLSPRKKIFMGDTGSLIIGFVLSIFTIKLLTVNNQILASDLPFVIENLPLVALVILIVPLFDTARVFTIRIFNKRSPFSADRNHLHHILIDLGLSHVQASILLVLFNLLFVVLFIYMAGTSKQDFLLMFLGIIALAMIYLFYRLDFSISNLRKKVFFRNKQKAIKEKIIAVRKNSREKGFF